MKNVISLGLVFMLCLGLFGCSGSTIEGKGYDSPEEALTAYAQALQSGDMDDILATFAIETYVDNYDLKESIESNGAYFPSTYFLPNSNDEIYDFNISQREAMITRNIHLMYIGISLDEEASMPVTLQGSPYSSAKEVVNDLSAEEWPFADMEFDGEFVYLDDVLDSDQVDRAEDYLDNRCDIYGCDEIVSLALEVEIDGEDYLLFMDVARFGDQWFNLNQFAVIATWMGVSTDCGGLVPKED